MVAFILATHFPVYFAGALLDLVRHLVKTARRFRIGYRPDVGFGIFISDSKYGQRPDEIYRSASKAAQRFVQLKESYEHAGLTTYLTLAEIRQLMDLTQEKVAEALAIKQPSVQRIENRGNVEVMTLARHVRALGGRLEMSVVFDDMEARLELSALEDRKS
jgi:DNA-binding XRE family transcriptional regulator